MDDETLRNLVLGLITKKGKPGDLGTVISTMVQFAMKQVGDKTNNDGPAIAGIATQCCLATSVCVAMAVGKKKQNGDETTQMRSTIVPETIMFGALLAAHQVIDGAQEHDSQHMAVAAEFSSATFGLALESWQKIYPDKKIDDYVEAGVANICRQALAASMKPFEDFLDKNKRGFFLPNNGSIN